jgi:hypothetical protein
MTTVALAGVVVLVLAVVHVPLGDYLARVFTDTWWWRVERASTGWCECPQQLHPSPRAPLLVLGSRRRYDRGRQASGSPVDAVA